MSQAARHYYFRSLNFCNVENGSLGFSSHEFSIVDISSMIDYICTSLYLMIQDILCMH